MILLFSFKYEKIKIVEDSGIMANIKTMTVTVDFYRQFEELNNKLDSLLKENKNLRREFKQETENLKAIIQAKDETIQKLLNEIDRLKNQINKNSSNSSKPSSTDIGRPKKSGANLYNSRKATTKKLVVKKDIKDMGLPKRK